MLRVSFAVICMAMLCLTGCSLNELDKNPGIEISGSPDQQFRFENVVVGKFLNGEFVPTLNEEDLKKCFSQMADSPVTSPEFRIIEGGYYLIAADVDSRIFLELDLDGADGYFRITATQIDCIGACICDWDGSCCVCNGGGTGSCKQVKPYEF